MMVFLGAFFMVFLAEMGDKSQLLAMTLATRYSFRTVLAGVALATFFNNGLAVFAGYYMRTALDLEYLQFAAAASFIAFGIWRLAEKDENSKTSKGFTKTAVKEKENTSSGRSAEKPASPGSKTGWLKPLLTVTALLFLSEIGDKTQMATVAYVIKYNAPVKTLLGVICGMVAADALAISASMYLARYFSATVIKYTSSGVFILIGLLSFYLLLT